MRIGPVLVLVGVMALSLSIMFYSPATPPPPPTLQWSVDGDILTIESPDLNRTVDLNRLVAYSLGPDYLSLELRFVRDVRASRVAITNAPALEELLQSHMKKGILRKVF